MQQNKECINPIEALLRQHQQNAGDIASRLSAAIPGTSPQEWMQAMVSGNCNVFNKEQAEKIRQFFTLHAPLLQRAFNR